MSAKERCANSRMIVPDRIYGTDTTALCLECGQMVRTTIPAGGDGSALVYYRHSLPPSVHGDAQQQAQVMSATGERVAGASGDGEHRELATALVRAIQLEPESAVGIAEGFLRHAVATAFAAERAAGYSRGLAAAAEKAQALEARWRDLADELPRVDCGPATAAAIQMCARALADLVEALAASARGGNDDA